MAKTKKTKKSIVKENTIKKPAKKVAKKVITKKSKIAKKVKKVKTSTIHHVVILDRSGSMSSVKNSTIGGFNENAGKIRDLAKADPNQKHTVTLVTFACENKNVSWLESAISIQDLTSENYILSGNTALCDAMGRTIVQLKDELEKTASDNSPISVLLTIITDGEENASKEYDSTKISALIESLKGNPNFIWTIAYMGANQDVMSIANKYNISVSNVAAYTSSISGTKSAFDNLSKSRDCYSRSFASNVAAGTSVAGASINFFNANSNVPADFTVEPTNSDSDDVRPIYVKNTFNVNNKNK